ncbi:hypothetical protein HMPREF1624_01231 [Sporothrix schenckii ATCC 58251]|uniref:TPR domain-containing protein n=1 Tax=Sporothrix schenckii (strain ATCC 58251 / de Perez 2211183) TaxID=1391915 RepID=U7Q6X8_SPOS1|nr:hypothetical protein HMPREF1624_01231 [Sporothrix schenckii ATCC 58251]
MGSHFLSDTSSGAAAASSGVKPRATAEPYYDLGRSSAAAPHVTTTSPEAQIWFGRALVWTYCFNHDEAIACYKQVLAHDDACAMAYWGLAFCSGPNYNRTWRLFNDVDRRQAVHDTFTYAQAALARVGVGLGSSPVSGSASGPARPAVAEWEKALICALVKRYPDNNTHRDTAVCDRAYADAMRTVYAQFGRDDTNFDMVTLFADALMNVAPRKLFDTATGEPIASSPVAEVRALLERALARPGVETHPGVAHYYIHLMEMSATPAAALPAADMIRDLVPDTGHTYHMPAHIDVLVGDYRRAVEYNHRATVADDKYFAAAGNGGRTFYSYYRLHDYHSLIYAAMLGGMSQAALATTDRMEATITEAMLRVEAPALADWMEFFLAVRVHVLIRFGRWDEVLRLEPKADRDLYCVTNVFRHYGHAIAYAATGRVAEAEAARARFRAAAAYVPPTRLDFPNKITDILHIATAMLDGEIAYRRADYPLAFGRLRDAVALEDALPFAEPWGWMLPARHAFAALSLEQGFVEEAAHAYAQDLGLAPTPGRVHQHPNNVWALHGYHECLQRLGRHGEAARLEPQLAAALADADVDVTSSCFCRVGVLSCGANAVEKQRDTITVKELCCEVDHSLPSFTSLHA